MNSFQTELTNIESELEAYYAADFDTELADTAENSRIKMQLGKLLNIASKELATGDFLQFKIDVLKVFSESTGCAEDEALFLSVTSDLVKNGVLSEEDIGSVLDSSSCQRWR